MFQFEAIYALSQDMCVASFLFLTQGTQTDELGDVDNNLSTDIEENACNKFYLNLKNSMVEYFAENI